MFIFGRKFEILTRITYIINRIVYPCIVYSIPDNIDNKRGKKLMKASIIEAGASEYSSSVILVRRNTIKYELQNAKW
ncbi:LOW QUALITY PROTEIN: hypothetical protein V1478_005185 [Vespula squamosa]|uniref:Uncharacterized protein n=1 Tax=Vespula squamosa TaxID=30214 RepID=A0ABD2BDF3_VESSQ